jgi:Cu+-exporting ATPase
MFPVLVWFYVRLARREEVASAKEFGDAWTAYAQATPVFIPQFGRRDVGVA